MKTQVKHYSMRALLLTVVIAIAAALILLPLAASRSARAAENIGMLYGRKENQRPAGQHVVIKSSGTAAAPILVADFPDKPFSSAYLAVSLIARSSGADNGNWFIVHLGANGSTITEADGVWIPGVSDAGKDASVEKKYGDWFFIPTGYAGTLYIPAAEYFKGVTTVTDFMAAYDAPGQNTLDSTAIEYRTIFAADEVGDTATEENLIFDFASYLDKGVGTFEDDSLTLTGLYAEVEETEAGSYYTATGVEITVPLANALKVTVKSNDEGGVNIPPPRDYAWLDITLAAPVTPADGLAFTVFGCSSGDSMIRLMLEDANGAFWRPNISFGPDPTSFPFMTDGLALSLNGIYNNFLYTAGDRGTVYVAYSRFANVTDPNLFKDKQDMPAATVIGDIVKLYVGVDVMYGLGRSASVGAFANVDITANTVSKIVDTAELSNTEVNLNTGTVIKCTDTAAHIADLILDRITESELTPVIDKTDLDAMIALCDALSQAEYTTASWKSLQGKLTVAKITSENEQATQLQIDTAFEQLSNARLALRPASEEPEPPKEEKGCKKNDSAAVVLALAGILAVALLKRKTA
jgi:hypothetical protein